MSSSLHPPTSQEKVEKGIIDNTTKQEMTISFSAIIEWQITLIQRQLNAGLLNKDVQIAGASIDHYLSAKDIDLHLLYRIFVTILESPINICQELEPVLALLKPNQVKILLLRHGFNLKTLEEVGEEIGVTRERIRQIDRRTKEVIYSFVIGKQARRYYSQPALLRIQSALLTAKQMGMEITFHEWERNVTLSGLVGRWATSNYQEFNPFEVMYAICNILDDNEPKYFEIPKNLSYAIKLANAGKPNVAAIALHSINTLSPDLKKAIRRHYKFSGGINVKWLAEETRNETKYIKNVLQALEFINVTKDWFIPAKNVNIQTLVKNDVFHHGLHKMFKYCGPLDVDNICSGIRHVVSRTNFPTPPIHVMGQILEIYEYPRTENGLYYWDEKIEEELSSGEEIIFECMKQNGSVVHHMELAQAFLDSHLSFPSLHATLKRSPLFEKVDVGLYKLRGRPVTLEDIERAKSVAERIPVNIEVRYDKSGNIIVQLTLGILAVATGNIYSEQLPNLSGEWNCYIQGKEYGKIVVTDNEFRRLSKPLNSLRCEIEERLEFIFNTWDRLVTIYKVDK
jgi:hypothetical protein